jgi:site-specific DNA recombinase
MARKKKTREPQPLHAGSRIACYCRDSGGGRQERSVADQRRELQDLATERGWVIVRWFVDAARPGGEVDHRDAFLEMLDECKRDPEQFDGIAVWDFARFSRGEPYDTQIYKATIRRLGIEVVSATENIPDGDFGPLVEFVIDLKNKLFLKDLSQHVKKGLRSNVAQGYAHGGFPPLGYMRQPEIIGKHRDGSPRTAAKWVPDPVTGPRMAEAFRLYAAGASYREIERAIGIARPDSAWSACFRNETYAGVLRAGVLRYPGAIPALCDVDTWKLVQERIMREHPMHPRQSPFLLSGVAMCGHCGGPLAGGTDRRNAMRAAGSQAQPWRYYRCLARSCGHGKRVNANLLEGRVVGIIDEQILTVATIRPLIDEVLAAVAGPALDERIAELNQRIGQAQRALGNLMDAVERGEMAGPAVQERWRQRQAELAGYAVERDELERRRAVARTELTDADLEAALGRIKADLAGGTEQARRMVKTFIRAVIVRDDQLKIEYRPELILAGTGFFSVPPRNLVEKACISAFLRPVST